MKGVLWFQTIQLIKYKLNKLYETKIQNFFLPFYVFWYAFYCTEQGSKRNALFR